MRTNVPASGGRHQGKHTGDECDETTGSDSTYCSLRADVGVRRTHEAIERLVEHIPCLDLYFGEHGRVRMNALRVPERRPVVILWMGMEWMGMRGRVKRCEDVRGNIQLILAIGRKERLFRAKIKHGEGRVGRGWDGKLLALCSGRPLVLFADEGRLFALNPRVIAGGVIFEPEDEVEVLGGVFDVEEIFFEVLEADRREVATCEYVVEADIENGGEAARADLAYCRGWVAEAKLEQK